VSNLNSFGAGMTLLNKMMTFFCVQSEDMFYTGNEKFLHTVRFMIVILLYNLGIVVLNATFNNISVVWWLSVLLVEKNAELHPAAVKFYHIMYRVRLAMSGVQTRNFINHFLLLDETFWLC
jgi:hypothetical protein